MTCTGLNLEHGRRFSGSQASLASIATNPPPATTTTTREYVATGGQSALFKFLKYVKKSL